MTKFIGRLLNIGIGKESVRGTPVAASFWLPKMELTQDDKIEQVINGSSVGVIADAEGADIVRKFSEGEITGRIDNTAFGLWLLSALGSEAAPVLVGGETIVYDHTFNVLETAQHPSLTVSVEEPNATAASGLRFALVMVDSLELAVEINEYAQYTVGFRGNKNATATNTPSYSTTERIFLPQHGSFKFATNLAGLDAAPAISIKRFNLSIAKNLEDDMVLGSVNAADRLNKQFAIEGTVELMYEDRSHIDTTLLGDLAKAIRIRLTNADVTLGVASNPRLTIDLAKAKLSEISRTQPNDDLVLQTISFKAFYSLADAKMVTAVLRNLQSTSY